MPSLPSVVKTEVAVRRKTVKFIFFQVRYMDGDGGQAKLADMLGRIMESMPISNRSVDVRGAHRFLADAGAPTLRGDRAFLLTTRRTSGIPAKLHADNTRDSLGLADGDGLAEDVAIACDRTGSVIALQVNVHSMTAGCIAEYLDRIVGGYRIELLPVESADSLMRVGVSEQVRKIRVRLAAVTNFSVLRGYAQRHGVSVEFLVGMQSLMSSPVLELAWGVGRARDGLSHASAIGMVRMFKEYHDNEQPEDILSLAATIKDDATEEINLLSDRVTYNADVGVLDGGEIDKDELLQAALDALQQRRGELDPYIIRVDER